MVRFEERPRPARAIVALLAQRRPGATICPSEAARLLGGGASGDWRPLMPRVRRAGRLLAAAGLIEVRQGGVRCDPVTARGPIRYARADMDDAR